VKFKFKRRLGGIIFMMEKWPERRNKAALKRSRRN